MKLPTIILLTLFLASCNSETGKKASPPGTERVQADNQDSVFSTSIIKNISDSSIINTTGRTIDILFNGVDHYLGGQRNPTMNFATECMVCEPIQVYKQGFLFAKRLYVTKDSITIYQNDRNISDTMDIIKTISHYGERKNKRYPFSKGSVVMKYQGQSCNDADFVAVNIFYDKGLINIDKLINASFFEYDLDNNGINEQYLSGMRNCSQELVLLRINNY